MNVNQSNRLFREHQIDQLTAHYRDNPDDALLSEKINYIMSLHNRASLLEQKILEIDEMISQIESLEDEI
jgi:hypothetical protein